MYSFYTFVFSSAGQGGVDLHLPRTTPRIRGLKPFRVPEIALSQRVTDSRWMSVGGRWGQPVVPGVGNPATHASRAPARLGYLPGAFLPISLAAIGRERRQAGTVTRPWRAVFLNLCSPGLWPLRTKPMEACQCRIAEPALWRRCMGGQ